MSKIASRLAARRHQLCLSLAAWPTRHIIKHGSPRQTRAPGRRGEASMTRASRGRAGKETRSMDDAQASSRAEGRE